MNMFFSINNGPFVHVYKYAASSDTTEDALTELMEANKPYLGADDGLEHVISYLRTLTSSFLYPL